MEKVVIIKNCSECINSHNNFAMMNGNAPMGVLSGGAFLGCTKTLHLCPDEGIPDWCPLNSLPQKDCISRLAGVSEGVALENAGIYIAGWNDCLYAITGGDG